MILAGNGTSLSANSSYTVASGAVLTLGGNSTVAGPATAIIGSLAGAGTVQNGNASTATRTTWGEMLTVRIMGLSVKVVAGVCAQCESRRVSTSQHHGAVIEQTLNACMR